MRGPGKEMMMGKLEMERLVKGLTLTVVINNS